MNLNIEENTQINYLANKIINEFPSPNPIQGAPTTRIPNLVSIWFGNVDRPRANSEKKTPTWRALVYLFRENFQEFGLTKMNEIRNVTKQLELLYKFSIRQIWIILR